MFNADARLLAEEKAAAPHLALGVYQPTDEQLAFHQSHALRRWFCGGFQSGKTEAGAAEAQMMATHYAPGEVGLIVVPDYPRAVAAKERFEKYLAPGQYRWNGTERCWYVAAEGGKASRVYLRAVVRNPEAVAGIPAAWAWLDEAALYPKEAWEQLRPRVAVARQRGMGWVFATTTPKGHNWLWEQAVSEAEPEDFLIHVQSLSNPGFPREEWEALKDKWGEDSPYFRQYYRGLFESFSGQAVPCWRRSQHSGLYNLVRGWPVYRAWDFGWTAPTIALWIMETPDEDVYVLNERAWTETLRSVILSNLEVQIGHTLVPADAVEEEFIDPSGAHGRAKEQRDPGWLDEIEEQVGTRVAWTRSVGEAEGLYLIRSWAADGKLYVHDRCKGMINALETAELADDPEYDRLRDKQHPQADYIDALRYYFANRFSDRIGSMTVRAA